MTSSTISKSKRGVVRIPPMALNVPPNGDDAGPDRRDHGLFRVAASERNAERVRGHEFFRRIFVAPVVSAEFAGAPQARYH
jgi:hypothetical protein